MDDASSDRHGLPSPTSWPQAIRPCGAMHHPINRGIGGGFITGVAAARGEWLILIPADLALDLRELRKYLDAAPDADVVVGVRSDRSDYSGYRLLVSWVNIRLIQLLFGMTRTPVSTISACIAWRRCAGCRIEYWRSAFFHAETLIKAKALGYRLVEVEISYVPRATGRQTGACPKLILRTVWDVLRFWVRWRAGDRDAN